MDYGISGSNINRTIIKVENALIKSRQFNLPKPTHNPTYQDDDIIFDYIIDVCEIACERPKKAKTRIQWQTQTAHLKSLGHLQPKHQTNYQHKNNQG